MMKAFRMLAKLRSIRGTALDIFGRTAERRMERALIGEYEALDRRDLGKLAPQNHALAVELARIPEHIRGYGHVKDRHLKAAGCARRRCSHLAALMKMAPVVQQATVPQPESSDRAAA